MTTTYLMSFLEGYIFEDIKNPVMRNGKPVGLLFDGGHGLRQFTKGKCSPEGLVYEGEWNREMVARLIPDARAIGFDARVLVPEDEDINIGTRAARANKIKSEEPDKLWYYISIHLNAANEKDCDKYGWCKPATGIVAYTCQTPKYKTAKDMEEGRALAKTFVTLGRGDFELAGNRSLPKVGYWQADFTVLYKSKMPAILTENLFMTNRDEVAFLTSEKGKETIASLHIAALCKHFGIPYAHIKA